MKWVIKDWAGNYPFNWWIKSPLAGSDYLFNTFDDAEEFLDEFLGDTYETDRQEYYIEQEPNNYRLNKKYLDPKDYRYSL